MTPHELSALIKTYRQRAPGFLRAQARAALEQATSRGDRQDWAARVRSFDLTDLTPRVGKMIFPVVMNGDIPGALATVQLSDDATGDPALEAPAGARARRWLTQTLGQQLLVEPAKIDTAIGFRRMTWRFGVELQASFAASEMELRGESMDLAIALAFVSVLMGRPPITSWVVSGALGEPGQIKTVANCVEKRHVTRAEAPDLAEDRCVLADRPLPFLPLLRRVYGDDVLQALATQLDQNATTLLDKADAAWRGRDEQRAATFARAAIGLTTTPAELARAHLILAADAVHHGKLADAKAHFAALSVSMVDAENGAGWSGDDLREATLRMAGAELDRHDCVAARTLTESVRDALDEVPRQYRPSRWTELMTQATGTLSRVSLLEGDLPAAIKLRDEALRLGPQQEHARSCQELATLLFLNGDVTAAEAAVAEARKALSFIPEGNARQVTAGFVRIVEVRWGLLKPSEDEHAAAAATAPDLNAWPQPSELIAILLASDDEGAALEWFESHIFQSPPPPHPAYVDFLVGACARAVARGFQSPRWRSGPVELVEALKTVSHPTRVAQLRDFIAGADPWPLIRGCLY